MKKVFVFIAMAPLMTWAAGTPKSSPALLEKGKASYSTNCSVCHGDKGDGQGPAGTALKPSPRNFAKDKFKAGDNVDQIFKTITNGMSGTAMTGYAHLSEEERWGLSYYVLQLKTGK